MQLVSWEHISPCRLALSEVQATREGTIIIIAQAA